MIKNKYVNDDGLIGVLVSPGFGAGWSTWFGDDAQKEFLAMDGVLVAMKLDKAPEEVVEQYCKDILGESPYMGGWDNTVVKWLARGTTFFIKEYDGHERLCFGQDMMVT